MQLDYDGEVVPLRGMYDSMEAELEAQRTIKRSVLTALFCFLKIVAGPIKVHVDTRGMIDGPWRLMETYGLEVEELSTMATQYWDGVWTGKWRHEQKEAWLNQIREVQMLRQVRGPAGAVMRETHDLDIKRPRWHTLLFEGQVKWT